MANLKCEFHLTNESTSSTTVNSSFAPSEGGYEVTAASPGRFGLAILVPYYRGRTCRVALHIDVADDRSIRLEVSGDVSRMQKAFLCVKGSGLIERIGEEALQVAVKVVGTSLKCQFDFIPHSTRSEWLYLFSEAECSGDRFLVKDLSFETDSPIRELPSRTHFQVNSASVFRNYLQIDFELFDPRRRLSEVRLSGECTFETVQWWTAQDIAHSDDCPAQSPPFPLPSPSAMEMFGPDFAWLGHSVRALISEFMDVPKMSIAASDALVDGLLLTATFEDGSSDCFNLMSSMHSKDIYRGYPFDEILRLVEGHEGRPLFLELGGRGNASSNVRSVIEGNFRYISVDIDAGSNVDVVADVHELSRHIAHETIDVVYSHSVLEHLIAPWKVVIESNRVLRIGGLFVAFAPVTWPQHAEPWDFWRFSRHAWPSLLNPYTGFEILKVEEHGNASIIPLDIASSRYMTRMQHDPAPLFSSVIARKIGHSQVDWTGWTPDLATGSYD